MKILPRPPRLLAAAVAGGLFISPLLGLPLAHADDEATISLGGTIFEDLNHNGTKDAGEPGFADALVSFRHPTLGTFRDAEGAVVHATTDADGRWHKADLPAVGAGETYRLVAKLPSPDYAPTVDVVTKSTINPNDFIRYSRSDLDTNGASDLTVDFPLAPSREEPEPEDPDAITILTRGHADVLYPEIVTAKDGSQKLALHAHADNVGVLDYDNLVMVHNDESKKTLPEVNTPKADYSFIGPPGSPVWGAGQEGHGGGPWAGASTESATHRGLIREFSFRLEAVTGPGGEPAPGDLVMWQGGLASADPNDADLRMFSSIQGLPMSWPLSRGKHAHFNWSYTAPGVYCLAFSVQAQMPDGSRQIDRQWLTQVIGSEIDPATVQPCGRTMDAAETGNRTVRQPTSTGTHISSWETEFGVPDAAFTTRLNDGKLEATFNEQEPSGPDTAYNIDDVIIYSKAGTTLPYHVAPGRTITWDTAQINAKDLKGDISWEITDFKGPGDLTAGFDKSEWKDEKFDTANGVSGQQLWPEAKRANRFGWQATRPGKYCVAMKWSATTASGEEVSDEHMLTIVADGPLDPKAYEVDDNKPFGQGVSYTGPAWLASEHGALDKTCAQDPDSWTRASEVPGPDDVTPDDKPWDVPNWTNTTSGAKILNLGHVDVASIITDGKLDTQVKDTTEEGVTNGGDQGISWHQSEDVVFQLFPNSETSVPKAEQYAFLGKPGSRIWQVTERQNYELLWPGWSTEHIPTGALSGGVDWKLTGAKGPGNFFLYTPGTDWGTTNVRFNTADGIDNNDAFTIPPTTHAHGTWTFTAEGTYCLAFERTAKLADGTPNTDAFTLAVAVGNTDPTKVDPSACGKTDPVDPKPVVKDFSSTTTPTISGTNAVGKTLKASVKAWTPSAKFTYQWLRDGKTVQGATKSSYKLTKGDAGKKISVKVTGSKSGYKSVSKTSKTVTIQKQLTSTATPKITGTTKVGKTLKAKVSTWKPSKVTLKYQWLRNGKPIKKATQSSYKLTKSDAGKKISVKVTGTKTGYTTVSKTSKTVKIQKQLTSTATPKITGTTKVGKTLKAKVSTWKPSKVTMKYQWLRDGKPITKATKSSYKLTKSDAGKKISVKVTGTKTGYTTVTKTSKTVKASKPTPKLK